MGGDIRHSFATDLVEGVYDISTVIQRFGRASVEPTMFYTYVVNRDAADKLGPADHLV